MATKQTSPELLAQLSYRIRTGAPDSWREFSMLWCSFNAVYGGEPDKKEKTRVTACIRRYFTQSAALRALRTVTKSIDKILAVPPGDMRRESCDPQFRASSQRYAAIYQDRGENAVGRLAAIGGILYQVRCNLLHGSKDPFNDRDNMLVAESIMVLQVLMPALEKQMK